MNKKDAIKVMRFSFTYSNEELKSRLSCFTLEAI